MPSFGDLTTEAGLTALNKYMIDYSYINGYRPSQNDVAAFEAIAACPDADKFPHAARWWNHIAGFAAGERGAFPGEVTLTMSAEAAEGDEEDAFDDLFGDDDDEDEDEEADDDVMAKAAKQQEENERLMKAELERRADAARKNKKAARSQIIFDVKPWDADTDLEELAGEIRKIELEGLTWGEGINIVPLAFGVKKLQVTCNVIDDIVQTELLVEKIEELEDYVQSVDIFAFNKL